MPTETVHAPLNSWVMQAVLPWAIPPSADLPVTMAGPVEFYVDQSIPDSDLVLHVSVVAIAEITNDGWLLRCAPYDEEAFGSSLEEVCREFLLSLGDRYHSLSGRGHTLSLHDKAVLERLRTLFEASADRLPNATYNPQSQAVGF